MRKVFMTGKTDLVLRSEVCFGSLPHPNEDGSVLAMKFVPGSPKMPMQRLQKFIFWFLDWLCWCFAPRAMELTILRRKLAKSCHFRFLERMNRRRIWLQKHIW
ncbi:hypothetical protein AVEN_110570-1 [Araneus ventricosus]|uniref:Uncharacterized protein n=1 Tax=Araneus ventricosus TaxID=182803 RepID=A0A4Y2LPG7_ARAVE|nr:hypothetical protein AVEN_110570-1 [Araneus ventricosus]